ncbi:MAG: gluconokinase [Spirochaetales bacterium]|nr:gluconokinase [Spirochaetales bacterium]
MIIIIMGVSGCGKTTLGELLSKDLKVEYFEADSFHPQANIDKMSRGIPLEDEDRWPWLDIIRKKASECQQRGEDAVFSCSALKESYRSFIEEELAEKPVWVYLKGDFDTIHQRMLQRKNHFQKADMLRSQFRDLEEPASALDVDINMPLDDKVRFIKESLNI